MKSYCIEQIRNLTDHIQEITLTADVAELAALVPGCHYRWHMSPDIGFRCYSCVLLQTSAQSLTFAMRLNPESASSDWLRSLKQGDNITLEGPFNHFPQLAAPTGGRNLVIAGGIGITPLTGVIARLSDGAQHVECHYFAASVTHAAYAAELGALKDVRLQLHCADGPRTTVDALLGDLQPLDRLHVCGPARLLSAVLTYCDARHFPRQNIAFELFTAPEADPSAEGGYDVEATESGVRLHVKVGQSLLEALEQAGLEPLYDCRRGECGLCALEIVEGDAVHRDFIMTPQEAARNNTIYPCVSHAKGSCLKLAL